jgi:hypothetical protein
VQASVDLYHYCNDLCRCIGEGNSSSEESATVSALGVTETYDAVELMESFDFGCKSSSIFRFGADPLMIVRFAEERELGFGNVYQADCRRYTMSVANIYCVNWIGPTERKILPSLF